MKLNEIASKVPDGIYVGAKLDKDSRNKIKKFCITHNIPNRVASDKLHTTIIYSRKYVANIKPPSDNLYPMEAKIKGFEVFDTRDGKRALVLKLNCKKLIERHNYIMSEYNTTYDYPEYIPHITISYDCVDFNINDFDAEFPDISLEKEYQEDLVLDWQNKEKNT